MRANFFVPPKKAEELISLWKDEHASHYGAPHGASGYRILRELEARFFNIPSDHLREEYVWPKKEEPYKREMVYPFAALGLTALPGGFFMWLTSGGNKAAVHPETGEVIIWSRRHGIPIHVVSCLKGHETGEIYIYSSLPDLAWWKTSDHQEG